MSIARRLSDVALVHIRAVEFGCFAFEAQRR
jgi:hypothetical protein